MRRVDSTADSRSVAVFCFTACLSLGLLYYAGSFAAYGHFFPRASAHLDPDWALRGYVWWAGTAILAYLIIPALVVVALPGERLRDYHLSLSGLWRHKAWYLAILALVLPVIWMASRTAAFRTFYPLYPGAGRSARDLVIWESFYAGQFVAIEFFFRGFLLRGLAKQVGPSAVFLAVIPYCMVHFGKPWPEVAASAVAGTVLGWLALKTNSIWGGVCVHIAAAWTMDFLALSQKGQLPW